MRYFKKIPGERLYLSPMHPDDAELHAKWMNDPEVIRFLGGAHMQFSLARIRAWFDADTQKPDNHEFVIVLREGNRPIGHIHFENIHPVNRTATFGMHIGEAEDRSKGYGAEALKLLVDYGFKWLGLRNIALEVNAENAGAIRCYEKAGFRQYGCRSGSALYDGRWVDEVLMEILAEDWL